MAITAMVTAKSNLNFRPAKLITLLSCITVSVNAGEWDLTPKISLEQTYTDNVELTTTEPISSVVTQGVVGLDLDFLSRFANFSLTSETNNLLYSHDSEINNNYLSLNASGALFLGTNGPELFASASVGNINRNAANNGIANLISGDTIQSNSYTTGIRYNIDNSTFSINSSIAYQVNRNEDNIGEFDGMSASFNANSNNNARTGFWQISSSYVTRDQTVSDIKRTSEQYRLDSRFGIITTWKLNPFIRFYDEDISSNLDSQTQETSPSWGPGIRWLISEHFQVDLSYNYVTDKTVSDDYVDVSIQWEPSTRTSLIAGFNKRFFGDSYNLNFQHATRRLSNSISYNESLVIFDRNSFERIDIGSFWCPPNEGLESIDQCFAFNDQLPVNELQLLDLFTFEPIESNSFQLLKNFTWSSKLNLARTTFSINASASRREDLETKIADDTLSASFNIVRRISGRSNLSIEAKYDYFGFDRSSFSTTNQEDRYNTISATYDRKLASSLSAEFTLQQINRNSNIERFNYEEFRAIINVTKEF